MSIHEKIDTHDAVPVEASMIDAPMRRRHRTEPDFQIWFALADDPLWKLGGRLAAAFVVLTAIGVLGVIAVSVAS